MHDDEHTQWDNSSAEDPPPSEYEMGAGQRLQEARNQKKLSLTEVAKETRIPERHLVAIENGDFNKLPARTYAVGFSRTYARLVGLDDKDIAEQVRRELAASRTEPVERQPRFEPGDDARVPSRGLAWFALFAVILLLVGGFAFYRTYFSPGMGPAPLTADPQIAANEAAGAAPRLGASQRERAEPSGPVVFTALEDGVWVRFYEAEGERLYEAQMAEGETFQVPSDAQDPQIWTGRPDAFGITIGGREIPKLAEDDMVMRDVAISADALLARGDDTQDGETREAATAAEES